MGKKMLPIGIEDFVFSLDGDKSIFEGWKSRKRRSYARDTWENTR